MDSVVGIGTKFLQLSSRNNQTSFSSVKSSSLSSVQLHQNPKTNPPIKTLSSSFLKATFVAITATSLFLNRFTRPSIAAVISPPALVEENEAYFSHFDEEALKSFLNVKIRPTKLEWVLKRSQFLARTQDYELALLGFEEVISKDPLNIDAYYGLISCINDSGLSMNICKQENKKLCLREFELFVAQIMVLDTKYTDAPYLCQGIVYTLLKKPNEAKKSFENYGILYVRQFEGNV
ncbi:hypothetical protein MKW94_008293 [Papaver nudicaule]|uniref:Uncharacterized protein n=1 Tax=Papaver nudicaule TaxID=74823 RepID=A0AA41VSH0_PAPNU|nr:hypothetical protein [Papaver nudicaule]